MSERSLKFAIIGHECKRQLLQPHVERMVSYLEAHGSTAVIEPEDLSDTDYVISLGGDGTFLKAAGRVGKRQIPIIGVNMGRLGFLADVLPSEIEQTLEKVFNHDYRSEERRVGKECRSRWSPYH